MPEIAAFAAAVHPLWFRVGKNGDNRENLESFGTKRGSLLPNAHLNSAFCNEFATKNPQILINF
jgi:hypothetical protein